MYHYSDIHRKTKIKPASWLNGTEFIYGAEGFRFDSCVSQIDYDPSYNNSPTLRQFLQKEVVLPGVDGVEMPHRQLVTHSDIYLKKHTILFSCNINTAHQQHKTEKFQQTNFQQ